jgi:hypothetical protein
MNSYVVGEWDGTHLWFQWDGDADKRYEIQLRFRRDAAGEWGDWQPSIRPSKNWFVHWIGQPLGTVVQAQIRERVDDNSGDWSPVLEAKFVRSLCKFELSSKSKELHFVEGTCFHCRVDGAVCSYRLTEEIEIGAGETKTAELEAVASDGFAQLDKENDFYLRPALGVVIRNVEPSRNDVEATGRDFTEVKVGKRDGPFTMAISTPQNIR